MFVSMNKLSLAARAQILNLLVEGSSLRSISRVCDVSINTVTKLLVDAGTVCAAYHDQYVANVKSTRIQCDEVWSFCYAKEKILPRRLLPQMERATYGPGLRLTPTRS